MWWKGSVRLSTSWKDDAVPPDLAGRRLGSGGGPNCELTPRYVLALLVKDKLLSPQRDGVAPSQANQELQTRVTRLELQTEALRDTQRDLRQLTETLGQLIRDLATKT